MRTRLTFLIRDLGYGGAQRQLVALATQLPRGEFEISVLHFYPGALENELRAAGIRTVCVGKRSRWDLIGFFLRLGRAARAEQPDVLHGYLTESNVMTALLRPLLRGTRIVWGLRDSQTDAGLWGHLGRFSFALSRLLSPRADWIIANSTTGRDYYASRGYPRGKMAVIPNGIDVERFAPDPGAGSRLRLEWGIAPDDFLFGHVGRLNAMKDHATLLRATALVCQKHPRARLLCVGGGDETYGTRMRGLADELGIADKVSWLPPRGQMTAVYNALDALVSSSSFGEGFPNVVAEAMACGVPCAVTDVGDSAQIVVGAGFAVPPSRPDALAEAMATLPGLSADAMRKLKVCARARIVENYSLPQLVRRTRETLLQLTGAEMPAPLRECLNSNA